MVAESIASYEHDLIPSYGPRALRRWSEGGNGTGEHQPGRCRCLTCADGRVLRGMKPLPVQVGPWTFAAQPSEVRR